MKDRRASGRTGGSAETEEQGNELERQRELRRRRLLEQDLAADQEAELAELVRTRKLGLDGLAEWIGTRLGHASSPGKVTRVELEIALAQRQFATAMSPRSALAYASWIVAAERGWSPANLDGRRLARGTEPPPFRSEQHDSGTTSADPAAPLITLANPLRTEAPAPHAEHRADDHDHDADDHDRDDHDHDHDADDHSEDHPGHWAGLPRPSRLSRRGEGAALPSELADRFARHLGPQGDRAVAVARLHTDDTAARIATAHRAHAVTLGSDIFFGKGELSPGTPQGDNLLVHELTHVAQGQRGELHRAAAKGLTGGTNLDASEAEAELRAKLATIELHAPPVTAPPVAAPSGQPASPGERAARLAAQQKRLAEAQKDTIPDAEGKPVAPSSPGAAVAHAAPEMTAPSRSGNKGNAYVEALDAPPSKQAMGLWDQTAGKATSAAAADHTAFEAALPPMPVQLSGDEDADKADAKGQATGAAHQPKGKEPPPGAVPPPTTAQPTQAAPTVSAATAAADKVKANPDKAAMETEGKRAMDALPTSSPATPTSAGTPPVTDLSGQADPVRVKAEQQQAYADGAKALDAEKKKLLAGPGATALQPKKLDEKLQVPKMTAPGEMPELPKAPGMEKLQKWNLPGNVQASFDDIARPRMEGNLAQAKAKMAEAQVKRDTDREKAVLDAQSKVKTAHVDADARQQQKVAEGRTKIANKQAETLGKQEAEVKKLDKQSGAKKSATLAKISDRVAKDQAKVDADYADAQKRAEAEKQKGEQDAQRKKDEAKRKAEEDKSWWDRVADAVCDAISAVAEAIDKALEAVGKVIGGILDAVKNAACALIDAARDFVCSALSEFGDWLKSAVTNLVGSVFPELAAAMNKLIDDAVNVAKSAVNAIADGLKTYVSSVCDGLKSAVDTVISGYRAAVKVASTLAKALVTGDWKLAARMALEGVLSLLGIDPEAFYAFVGKAEDSIAKIIADPGAFVGHLVDAVKLGFQQFGANFLTHLKDGVIQWLFGAFAEAGIRMPSSFDIAGVFDLTCQVLGLTWPRLRPKVVKAVGAENTERLEFVAQYVEALVTGGFTGLWDKIKQDMSSLWDIVIGGARQWLMEKLVQQAIIKIATMWNPAGAIIQLIQTAWNVYCWVQENAKRIFGLVQAVVDSISNIANGNIASAANYIESSLAKLVPIAISLFANLLGLGGIADKIKSIITKVQTKIDQAIDKLVARVAATFKGKGKASSKDDKAIKGDGKGGKSGNAATAKASGKGGATAGADTSKSKDKKPDENKQVGARITFRVGSETHTQYIDKGVPMVASTPTGVKAKIEEWRPRLRELPEDQKKKAGGLIGKAIGIEKKVATLATQAKTDKSKDAALEAKQRELADTLAQLWELMAPDMDKSKSFAEQDPKATLKSDQYKQFKQRFTKLAQDLAMPGGDAKAQEIWLQVVTALQKTDAAYKAAPTDAKSGRKDLAADGFQKIMADFDPITSALKPYMDKWTHGKKSWAFWSGKPAVELAKKHAEVCLEKSALGGLFDNINISGSWDIQMWASLSRAYATHAAAHIGDAKYAGFVGMGSSADQSIFNKIEQPTFVGMLNDKQKVSLHIDWFAAAGDPKSDMKQPDWRFTAASAGSIDGVYAKGDRASMVAKAEAENKRRLDLWKEKGIDEGPNGTEGSKDGKGELGARVAFNAGGHAHTQYIDNSGPKPVPMVASTPTAVEKKLAEWKPLIAKLSSADQSKANSAVTRATDLEKEVTRLAEEVKKGGPDGKLRTSQQTLADCLLDLFILLDKDGVDPEQVKRLVYASIGDARRQMEAKRGSAAATPPKPDDDFQRKLERLMHKTIGDYELACNARASKDGNASGFQGNTMTFAGGKYFIDHQNNYVVPDADVRGDRAALGGKVYIYPAKGRPLTSLDQLKNEPTRDNIVEKYAYVGFNTSSGQLKEQMRQLADGGTIAPEKGAMILAVLIAEARRNPNAHATNALLMQEAPPGKFKSHAPMVAGGTDDPHKPRDQALTGGLDEILNLPPDKVTSKEIDMVKTRYESNQKASIPDLVKGTNAATVREDLVSFLLKAAHLV